MWPGIGRRCEAPPLSNRALPDALIIPPLTVVNHIPQIEPEGGRDED